MTAARAAKLTALGFVWEAGAQRKLKKELDRGEPCMGMTAAPAAKLTALGFVWEAGAQRKLKKRLDRGEVSNGMTAARAAKLMALGFAWEAAASRDDAGWEGWLAKLAQYKAEHGDCHVPYSWAEDPGLGSWASRQRNFKRKLDRGEPSGEMTAARAAELTGLVFAWEVRGEERRHDAGWEGWLAKLIVYKAVHGDCNVPYSWAEDPGLGRWVSRQRQLKKKLDRGEPCKGMTAGRAAKLTAPGFAWTGEHRWPRQGGPKRMLAAAQAVGWRPSMREAGQWPVAGWRAEPVTLTRGLVLAADPAVF
jgi:hypothetical protein